MRLNIRPVVYLRYFIWLILFVTFRRCSSVCVCERADHSAAAICTIWERTGNDKGYWSERVMSVCVIMRESRLIVFAPYTQKTESCHMLFSSVERHYCHLSVEQWTVSEWRCCKTGCACSTYGADVKCVQNASLKTCRKWHHLEYLGVDGCIILKLILKMVVRVWTGFWRSVESSGGLLYTRLWTSRSYDKRGICVKLSTPESFPGETVCSICSTLWC